MEVRYVVEVVEKVWVRCTSCGFGMLIVSFILVLLFCVMTLRGAGHCCADNLVLFSVLTHVGDAGGGCCSRLQFPE